MQQPSQQQQFVPYFNQPRVQHMPAMQQQAPMVYAEQQQQQPAQAPQTLIYPQIHPQMNMPQQQHVEQQQGWCSRQQGGCRWSKCCKKFNLQKGFKAAVITPIVSYFGGFLLSLFAGRYHGTAMLYIMPIMMAIVAAIVGIVGLRKKNVTFIGVFLGMVGFSLLAGFYNFTPALFLAFSSFFAFVNLCLEILAVVAKIGSIVMAVKLIKKIQNQESFEFPVQEEDHTLPMTIPQPIVQQQQIVAPQVVAPTVIPQQQFVAPQQQQLPPVPQKSFEHELNLLREMGFSNVELNTRLLAKHNGNLAQTLQELVSQ